MAGMNMEARNQLVSLLGDTINDLSDLVSSSESLEHEDNKKVTNFATTAISRLEELKGSLGPNGFVDTIENVEKAGEMRDLLGSLRTKMFSMSATDMSIGKILNDLDRGVRQLQDADIRGKIAKKVDLQKYGEDDLVCSITVTSWLNESSSFIKNLKAIMNDHPTLERMSLLKISEDEEYASLSEQIAEAEELAATAETDEEADLYIMQLEDLEKMRNERIEEINEINREKRAEYLEKQQARKTGYESVLKLLESIYKQFTGRSLVSYKKRAEILERSGIGSFDDIFERLSEARADGNVSEILMVEGKLKGIIDEYEKSKAALKDAEGVINREAQKEKAAQEATRARVEQLKRERMGITEEPKTEVEDKEKAARAERLAKIRASRGVATPTAPTTEEPTKTPEVGTVEQVNVKEEKDPWAELLKEKR